MATATLNSSLSAARQALLKKMQAINFGRLECLIVRSGDPILVSEVRAVREYKLGSDEGRREIYPDNYFLKLQVIDLFHRLDELGDGVIDCLEVKHGLPFKMEIRDTV